MKELLLGVSKQKTTPKLGCRIFGYQPNILSTKVVDDLETTAFIFESGSEKVAMISVSVCLIDTQLANRIKTLIEKSFGISFDKIMISATHTHSGPSTADMKGWGGIDTEYVEEILIPKIMLAVKEATESVQPVKMGVAYGKSLTGVNRRVKNEKNDIDFGECEWGVFNPEMTVISFIDKEKKNVGTMIYYGAHGTSAGCNVIISRDWSGVMVDRIEKIGGGICAFFCEPEGDVAPRVGEYLKEKTYDGEIAVKIVGDRAAADAERIFLSIKEYESIEVAAMTEKVRLPLDRREDLETAQNLHEKYKHETVNIAALYAKHYGEVIESYKNGYVDKEYMEIPQTVVRLGDIVIVGFPFEVFAEIGLRIDSYCKKYKVISLACTNGHNSYFPTHDQLREGGYEINMFNIGRLQPFSEPADYNLICETLKNIEKI